MAKLNTNAGRPDPYKNFKFQVSFTTGTPVAGLSKASALKRTTEVIEWREAGDPSVVRKLPGRSKYEPVTLEAGLSQDHEFLDWANQVNNPEGDASTQVEFRKDVTIEVLDMQGTPAIRFTLRRAWPSEFQALPELDANSNAVAIQSLKLEYEGLVLEDIGSGEG